MNEYNDISSNVESISDTSEAGGVLSTTELDTCNTSSYTDNNYLQGIYEVTLANTALVGVIMVIIIICGLSAMMKGFFD